MQLDKLWQFMQVDMEADRFENGMRQSEKRQKLLKQRPLTLGQASRIDGVTPIDVALIQVALKRGDHK